MSGEAVLGILLPIFAAISLAFNKKIDNVKKCAVASAEKSKDALNEYKLQVAKNYMSKTDTEKRFDKIDNKLNDISKTINKL